MSVIVRDGSFDVVVAAGPGVRHWPSVGPRAISSICASAGLDVGVFGGEHVSVRGVIPLPGTGGIVIVQDVQGRIHRIRGRAIVKVSGLSELPDPFPGWRSEGMIPLSAAQKLKKNTSVTWGPTTVLLGTGNRALRFASELLESEVSEVYCVEISSQWGAKRFAGWEVERRRFEMLGGRMLEARPLGLTRVAPLLWQLRLQDSMGVRVLDIARVISAGPFKEFSGNREYPRGSFLFELEQTAPMARVDDIEGWVIEEERGRWLAGKIARSLTSVSSKKRDDLETIYRRARGRLKRYFVHRDKPFTPTYQGKWLSPVDSKSLRAFSGVPKVAQKKRLIASVECIEEIPCNICEKSCPESAIRAGKVPRKEMLLTENLCTGCGACIVACPSRSIVLMHEREDRSTSEIVFPAKLSRVLKAGDSVQLTNRRGEFLGSGRVQSVAGVEGEAVRAVRVEVPTHLVWDARSFRKIKTPNDVKEVELDQSSHGLGEKVEIFLNAEKRLVRQGISITEALFEIAHNRPEDMLICSDGSCGLCDVFVDGVRKCGCQTEIRKGMSVKLPEPSTSKELQDFLCPCLEIRREEVIERLKHGKLQSPDAVLSVSHVGQGPCHGRLCLGGLKRLLQDQGLDSTQWIDWRFPWSNWELTPS